ncbi:hypothetical protein B5F40_01195 [Gordonibacter sp. An230]|uniref:helix-turn-helix transcriptional regulator n=1 Tax=Gordonibacter sp. An230 TaxID=1965592 RepID=UPI000B378A9B|nr:helix-turn-helix transcriptional regulator [Gordonibacter sp. An230]OUO92537.1 hypothetical protein B5F40_01195 [Gordonibacter sp. An230]
MVSRDVQGFANLAHEELRHPARLFGMALFWTWLQIVFSSAALSLQSPPDSPVVLQHQVWTLSLLITCCVFFVTLVARPLQALRRHSAVAISSALMAAGTLCLSIHPMTNEAIIGIVGAAGTGIGSALAFLRWGDHLSKLKPRRVLFDMAAYAVLTAVLFGLVAPLPPMATRVAAVTMPLASGVLLYVADRTISEPAHMRSAHDGRKRHSIDLLGLAVLGGLVYGVMRSATLNFGQGTAEEAATATVIGVAISGLLLTATTVFYRKESELYLVCEVSFPLLAAGFLLLPQFTGHLPLPLIVSTIGHGYFYFLLWVFCVDQSHATGRDPFIVFSAGLLAFLGSSLIGSVISDALTQAGFEGSEAASILSLVVVYLFVLAFAVLFRRARSDRSRDMREMNKQHQQQFEHCTQLVAEDGGLTARETEIFALLVHGKDRAAIREQLCISNDTVKTHTRRIYAKLGIHAKQEARALVEACMDRETRGM